MKRPLLNYLWLAVALVLVIGGLTLLSGKVADPEPAATSEQQQITITLQVDDREAQTFSVPAGTTALGALEAAHTADPALSLVTKEYAGMGTLVESMHGRTNGTDDKYWQYEVNGVMPQVGAGALTLKEADSVRWFFGAFEDTGL